ncbi:hypothetical protein HMPREF0290_1698 [Corynebacterium efficiens YS-314]|uniref:Uncharacterized protein n=1 Tax=Corynebacterium efficiens (strain DSM 44549 / YS-314 / AJ 12310 / JCM 11189 / NBRC 100395) TaxID=196164 RepID=Q8FTA7_COREF|nr:hypothetical protein HMPREF0290_1698 [Corynebacterium efficiens YS-314]BAC18472.1 hypothetical protein [Corynebacterium efficiens YS-314]
MGRMVRGVGVKIQVQQWGPTRSWLLIVVHDDQRSGGGAPSPSVTPLDVMDGR